MARKVEIINEVPDYVPKKKKKEEKMENPLEKRTKLPDFSEKYEEDLKRKLFEEDLKRMASKNVNEDEEESEYYETDRKMVHHKRDGDWDVPIGEDIKYFDPELSYEITGYRPINMTQGLDFDPTPFQATGKIYTDTGKYTEYPPKTKPYNDFWTEQLRRCTEGYTVGKYRITGDQYFFLNFYRMKTVAQDAVKDTTGRNESFPSFVAKQYEFFHYIEICEYIGKDVCLLKSRGMGMSEILADLAVRPFITTRKFRTLLTAAADDQLDPLLDKAWYQLNWLNSNTNGGMKRSRQKVDNIRQKRASLLDKDNVERGRFSEIEGRIANNPRKVRGDRVERLVYEEAGSAPNLIKSWVQGTALVELGGKKIGIKIALGTGGDDSGQVAGLARIFNNPLAYNVLPYKNSYTLDGKIAFTGFFIPAYEFALDPKYVDHRGVTNSIEFKKYYEAKRALMEGQDLLTFCAEYCFTPNEALLKQGDNLFNAELLSDQITQIRVFKNYTKPEQTALIWDGNNEGKIKAIPSKSSKLLVVEPPLLDKDGQPYKNLYVAGIDSIDVGANESATDYDVSDFCIVIKKRMFGMEPPKYVAMYKDRPNDIREAYEMARKLLTWYNAKAMLEYTKIGIQRYFQNKNCADVFMARPEYATTVKNRMKSAKRLIGLPATEAVIKHGLELIGMYVNEYVSEIDFDEMLEQLLNYSYEDKRKFDIVAALGQSEIADEELTGVTPTTINNRNKTWQDVGYYRNDKGYIEYGVIPKKNTWETRWLN